MISDSWELNEDKNVEGKPKNYFSINLRLHSQYTYLRFKIVITQSSMISKYVLNGLIKI